MAERQSSQRKQRARRAVRYAVKTGRLTRGPCEVCGEPLVHGHHQDYSKPLAVQWLCGAHHRAAHGKDGSLTVAKHVRFPRVLLRWLSKYAKQNGFSSDAALVRHIAIEYRQRVEQGAA